MKCRPNYTGTCDNEVVTVEVETVTGKLIRYSCSKHAVSFNPGTTFISLEEWGKRQSKEIGDIPAEG